MGIETWVSSCHGFNNSYNDVSVDHWRNYIKIDPREVKMEHSSCLTHQVGSQIIRLPRNVPRIDYYHSWR